MSFDTLEEAPNGEDVAGRVVLEVRDTIAVGIATIAIAFDGNDPTHGQVLVTLDDGEVRAFAFDFATDSLVARAG